MTELHVPNWRKFISLKGELSPPKNFDEKATNDSSVSPAKVVNPHAPSNVPENPPPAKKRKIRTEDEIAQRKIKKLKSKGKEDQEWKRLSETHAKEPKTTDKSAVPELATEVAADSQESPGVTKTETTLLSAKAKEIKKARREEKLQQNQGQKTSKKDVANMNRKAGEVLKYLTEYREHVDSDAPWKFKKQHQNWIVKHLYDYAWTDDDLLIKYLKTVQGKARERIIEDGRKIIDASEEDGNTTDEAVIRRAQSVIKAIDVE